MTDRRDWIEARTRELSDQLGYKEPPTILFQETNQELPVLLNPIDFTNPKERKLLEPPELWISPEAFNLTDRELAYRLTFALVNSAPHYRSYVKTALVAMLVLPGIVMVTSSILALIHSWLWLLALPATFLVIPIGFIFLIPIMDRQVRNSHLEAIDITGDAVTGLGILRARYKDRRPWQGKGDTWLARSISREAEKRGYRVQPELDR